MKWLLGTPGRTLSAAVGVQQRRMFALSRGPFWLLPKSIDVIFSISATFAFMRIDETRDADLLFWLASSMNLVLAVSHGRHD